MSNGIDILHLYQILTGKKNKNFFMAEKTTKKVKLQPKHRALAYSQKIVPELKVSGVWLEEAGFRAGEKVNITISDQQLIITTINPNIL